MAMTEADLARIRRELDDDLEKRLARAGHHRPEPREPQQTEAQRKKLHDDAWTRWVDDRIKKELAPVIEAVGIHVRKKIDALRDEFAAAIPDGKAEIAEQLQDQVASVVRDFTTGALAPLRAELDEVKGRLAEAEAKLTAATSERVAPLALPPRDWIGNA
jgi:hypothetical protein